MVETTSGEVTCPRCQGRRWVCEQHPDQPFEHKIDGKPCAGPGDPCPECTTSRAFRPANQKTDQHFVDWVNAWRDA